MRIRGRCGDGNGTSYMKCVMYLRNIRKVVVYWPQYKSSKSYSLPFKRDWMSSWMCHLVQISEEFFTSIKKGPMRKNTDGFDSVDCIVFFNSFIVLHIQPGFLFLCHFLFGKTLIKCDCRAIHLLREKRKKKSVGKKMLVSFDVTSLQYLFCCIRHG